jgi:hypothetical protein
MACCLLRIGLLRLVLKDCLQLHALPKSLKHLEVQACECLALRVWVVYVFPVHVCSACASGCAQDPAGCTA